MIQAPRIKAVKDIPHFRHIIVFLFFLIVSIDTHDTAHSQELENILKSLESGNYNPGQKHDEALNDPWLTKGTNLAKIFSTDGNGMSNILEWLGDLTSKEFKLTNKTFKNFKEYNSLKLDYLSEKNENVEIVILVPHPKYVDLIKTGLLDDFYKQEPPGMPVVATEKMLIKANTAYFYQRKEGGCSLLFKLPKSSTLNLVDNSCHDNHTVVKLAELLNLERLSKKLES